jgi:hypothetical protein
VLAREAYLLKAEDQWKTDLDLHLEIAMLVVEHSDHAQMASVS